jgi:hypothetical protein
MCSDALEYVERSTAEPPQVERYAREPRGAYGGIEGQSTLWLQPAICLGAIEFDACQIIVEAHAEVASNP